MTCFKEAFRRSSGHGAPAILAGSTGVLASSKTSITVSMDASTAYALHHHSALQASPFSSFGGDEPSVTSSFSVARFGSSRTANGLGGDLAIMSMSPSGSRTWSDVAIVVYFN